MKTTCCKLCQSERKKNITLIKHFKIMLINRDQTPSIQLLLGTFQTPGIHIFACHIAFNYERL